MYSLNIRFERALLVITSHEKVAFDRTGKIHHAAGRQMTFTNVDIKSKFSQRKLEHGTGAKKHFENK